MSRRGFWWRLGGATILTVVLYVVFSLMEFEPHALPLTLVVVVAVVGGGLFVDGLGVDGQSWAVDVERWTTQPGRDRRFAQDLRIIAGHLTARTPEPALRDRLAELATRRLEQRHRLGRDDPRAAGLLGPDLTTVLNGPPRRLTRAEIDRCVRRIEEL